MTLKVPPCRLAGQCRLKSRLFISRSSRDFLRNLWQSLPCPSTIGPLFTVTFRFAFGSNENLSFVFASAFELPELPFGFALVEAFSFSVALTFLPFFRGDSRHDSGKDYYGCNLPATVTS